MDEEEKLYNLISEISTSIKESGLSISAVISVMDYVKEDLNKSTAFSDCIVIKEPYQCSIVRTKEGEKNA